MSVLAALHEQRLRRLCCVACFVIKGVQHPMEELHHIEKEREYILEKCIVKEHHSGCDRPKSKKLGYLAGFFAFFFDFGVTCGSGGVDSKRLNTSRSDGIRSWDCFFAVMVYP